MLLIISIIATGCVGLDSMTPEASQARMSPAMKLDSQKPVKLGIDREEECRENADTQNSDTQNSGSQNSGSQNSGTQNSDSQNTDFPNSDSQNTELKNADSAKDSNLISTGDVSIVTGKHYDSFYISMSPKEFKQLGFELGDGVDVILSNGETYYNIPFYSGDYCRLYEYYVFEDIYEETIDICCNYLPGFYIEEGITDETTVNIVLHEKGKYKNIEDHLNMEYSNEVSDYPNEEVFANFRSLSGGKIAQNKFFRGASPCNNYRNRTAYVNKLMRDNNIAYVLDLADSRKTFENYRDEYGEEYTYDWDLFLNSKMYFVEMDFDYTNTDYKAWIVEGLRDLIKNDGPYYIHCNEGMDRTGFVCAILEGLAGASYE